LLISNANGRNLMAKDEFKNLGFTEHKPAEESKKGSGADEGTKGELRW
jgi:hypothetical protein